MKSETIFNAYARVRDRMESVEHTRSRRRNGIAVDTDQDALRWQRLDRQRLRFASELLRRWRKDSEAVTRG